MVEIKCPQAKVNTLSERQIVHNLQRYFVVSFNNSLLTFSNNLIHLLSMNLILFVTNSLIWIESKHDIMHNKCLKLYRNVALQRYTAIAAEPRFPKKWKWFLRLCSQPDSFFTATKLILDKTFAQTQERLSRRELFCKDFKIQRRDCNRRLKGKFALPIKLYRDFSYALTLSNVGEPN